ncbi:MAG TPA: DUF692 domain-containing protein, partial [Steroidobacteraceae bacterium]|nr:DUF692 domain-containing protein [Steroidobacteraceae bacterium]
LERVRGDYPVSLHGVGLSLGGAEPLNQAHLGKLKALVDRIEPAVVSEHLAWVGIGGVFLNDLLPLPYTEETLARVVEHVEQLQQALGRRVLIENPATYLRFRDDSMSEAAFLRQLVARSGCGLLLDLNNVHVSAINHGYDAHEYLAALPLAAVGEIHLAGHARQADGGGRTLLIDSHDAPVDPAVWSLYEHCLALTGPLPTLIEWDSRLPEWQALRDEAGKAQRRIDAARLARRGAAA